MGAGERPVLLLTPLVGAHDKKLYRLGMGKIVGNILKEIVVPAQSSFILVKWSGGAEVDVADLAAGTAVPPNRNQEMLSAARDIVRPMKLYSDIVAQRSAQKNVIPGSDRQRGYADVSEMILDRPALPIVVIVGVGQPVEKIRS